MSARINLNGRVFGRWTVLRYSHNKNGKAYWECECICGVTKAVSSNGMMTGDSKSCGCLQREIVSKRLRKHNLCKTPEYKVWLGMKERCNNKNSKSYKDYGGRGIKICDRWNNFGLFYQDMGQRTTPKHSIERIDNDKGYEPDNCKWGTITEQSNNKRSSVKITYKGITKPLEYWSKKTGICRETLHFRFNSGWEIEKMLTHQPIKHDEFQITYKGETKNVSYWARATGISRRTIKRRLASGYPVNLALSPKKVNVANFRNTLWES